MRSPKLLSTANLMATLPLFEAWRRAFDAQDHAAMRSARQAIDFIAAASEAGVRPADK